MNKEFGLEFLLKGKPIKNPKGPLIRFLHNKANDYVPPTRKGTPKGEPIGFAPEKYMLALLLLTAVRLKDAAKWIKISDDVSRKWNSEDGFKAKKQELMDEFKNIFLDHIAERWDRVPLKEKDLLKRLKISEPILLPEIFTDIKQDCPYSAALKNEIIKEIGVRAKDRPDLLYPFLEVMNFWDLYGARTEKEFKRALEGVLIQRTKLFTHICDGMIRDVSGILKQDIISKDDRTRALQILKYIDFCLENLDWILNRQ